MTAIADIAEARVRRRRNRDAEREGREQEITTVERWARDPLGWMKAHVWIASKFQDGEVKRVRPLRLHEIWPDQERTLRSWINVPLVEQTGELEFFNVLVEKSRQIGETWILAAAVDWLLTYHHVRGLFMHTRAAEVADRGWTVDSFFGRVKFIHDRCVAAEVPGSAALVFRPFSTDPASIQNSLTGALLRGECQRDDPGRGSSFDFAIIDEAAHVAHGESVHAAIDDAAPAGKLYLSTPEGSTNMHARMCDEKPAGWEYLRLHWSEHPIYGAGAHIAGKDPDCAACEATREGTLWTANDPRSHRYPGAITSDWYDRAVIGKTDEQVASELDIDRERSLTGRVYPEFKHGIHVIQNGIPYDPALPVEFAWDFGLDCTSVPVIQDGPEDIRIIGLVEMGDLFGNVATPEQVSVRLLSYLAELGVPAELLTSDETLRMRAIGDPAGQARSLESAKPYVGQYRNQGFKIERPPTRLTARVDFSIISVQRILTGAPKQLRVCGVNAREFAVHMASNRWRTDAHGVPTQPRALLDDVHNHCCFVAGTMITTARGPVPIERVTLDDLVWTRDGWRPVIDCGPTGAREVLRARFDGGEIIGTGDHPMFVRGEGWVPLGSLDNTMSLHVGGETPQEVGVILDQAERGVARVAEETADNAGRVIVVDVEDGDFAAGVASVRLASARHAQAALPSDHRLVLSEGDPVLAAQPLVAVLGAAVESVGGRRDGAMLLRTRQAAGRVSFGTGGVGTFDRGAAVLAVAGPEVPAVREFAARRTQDVVSGVVGTVSTLPQGDIVDVGRVPGKRSCTVFNLTVAGTPEFFANGALVHNCRAFAYWAVATYPPPAGGKARSSVPQGRIPTPGLVARAGRDRS